MDTIGQALKRWREVRGLSQWDLADKSGVGYATIARLETNRIDPRVSTLERLAKALEIDIVEFFREPNDPTRRTAKGKR
jgi:transcriptional regulator with XRE-family HTH domain